MFGGISREELQKERDEILQAQPEDIRKLAELIEAVWKQGNVCVVGSESSLKKHEDLLKHTEPLMH